LLLELSRLCEERFPPVEQLSLYFSRHACFWNTSAISIRNHPEFLRIRDSVVEHAKRVQLREMVAQQFVPVKTTAKNVAARKRKMPLLEKRCWVFICKVPALLANSRLSFNVGDVGYPVLFPPCKSSLLALFGKGRCCRAKQGRIDVLESVDIHHRIQIGTNCTGDKGHDPTSRTGMKLCSLCSKRIARK
jgi:hypothetical protein